METYKEERYVANQESKKAVKPCIACLWSFLVSITGGLILGWWEYKHHSTNSQLWMVPFGLILFVTPAIVCFAVFVSEACNPNVDGHSRTSQPDVL